MLIKINLLSIMAKELAVLHKSFVQTQKSADWIPLISDDFLTQYPSEYLLPGRQPRTVASFSPIT